MVCTVQQAAQEAVDRRTNGAVPLGNARGQIGQEQAASWKTNTGGSGRPPVFVSSEEIGFLAEELLQLHHHRHVTLHLQAALHEGRHRV
jgi:hypothetical protein